MSQKEKNSSLSLLKKGSYLHKEEQQSLQKEPGVIPAPHPFLKGFEQSEFAEDRWWLLNMQYFVPDLSFPLYTDTHTLKPSRRKSAFTPALHLTKIFWTHSSAWAGQLPAEGQLEPLEAGRKAFHCVRRAGKAAAPCGAVSAGQSPRQAVPSSRCGRCAGTKRVTGQA